MRGVLALDIGGTKIAAGLVDERGTVLRRSDLPTPCTDAEQTFDAVGTVLDEVRAGVQVDAVGIACAGPVDAIAGTVSPINLTQWHEFPLVERVTKHCAGAPVALGNDGLCMALGEHWRGAGQGMDNLLGMVVSTGVGGGLVINGAGYLGRTGNAGHVGHIVVEPDGAECSCGGRGCVETVASGPCMVRWARVRGWQAPDHAHAEHLAAAAKMGEEIACSAFQRAGRAIGYAIAATAALCDLDLAVVGGGVARAGQLLFDPIRETLATHSRLSFVDGLRVVPAKLEADAGLIGAAALVARNLGAK